MTCTIESHERTKRDSLAWSLLSLVTPRWQLDPEEPALEIRNCHCGSTLCRPVKETPMDNPPDVVTAVISALDAHLALTKALTYHPSLGFLPDAPQFADVRHAVLLWASANGCIRVDEDDVIQLWGQGKRGTRVLFVSLHIPEDFVEPARAQVDQDQLWTPRDHEARL